MELRCPHCKTAFQVDENDYAAILAQVKTAEFEAEVQRRMKELLRSMADRRGGRAGGGSRCRDRLFRGHVGNNSCFYQSLKYLVTPQTI